MTFKNGPGTVEGLEDLTPEELFREGFQHFKAKEFARARLFLERYMDLLPSDARVCHLLARVYYHENDNLDKAADCLERAVQLDPEGACGFYQTMAEIYIHLGEYSKAEEVLALAAEKDTGEDPKLTHTIDFYRNLVKKKNRAKLRSDRPEKEPPGYYSAKRDERYNRKGRHLFLLPSILVHLLVLLFLGHLSGMNMVPEKETPIDFAYIDVGVIGEEQTRGAETSELAEGEANGSAQPSAAERAPVEVGAPGRQTAAAQIGGSPEFGSGGPRALSAEKAAAGLDAEPTQDNAAAAPGSAEKRMDIAAARVREMPEGEVNFRPGRLGLEAGEEAVSERAEARVGVMTERRGRPAAAVHDSGAQTARAGDRAESSGRKAGASLKAESSAVQAPAPSDTGEKSVVLDRPSETVSKSLFADAGITRSAPGELSIKASGAKGDSGAGPSQEEAFGTVKRGGSKAAAAAFDAVKADRPSEGPGLRAAKGAMSLPSGSTATAADAPRLTAKAERIARLDAARPGRQISGAEPLPASRDLGISVGKTAGTRGPQGATVQEAPKGISSRQASAAPSRAGGHAGVGVELGGPARGYSAARSGKGINAGALSGGEAPAGAPAGIKTTGDKVASITGTPGRSGMASVPESMPRSAGGLEGLVKDTRPAGGGAPGGKGGGTGEKPGVMLGSGEKTGTAAPPGSGLSGPSGADAKAGAASLEKRDSEGALGVPGGKGQERYAAVAKARTAPIAPEKKSGVSLASKSTPKGLFGLSVKILTPAPGNTRELTQLVTGMVSDPKLTKATLTVNNDSRVVSVTGGRFEAEVALSEGKNVITAMAFDRQGNAGKDTVTVNYKPSGGSVPVAITEPRDGQVFDVSRGSTIKVRGTIGDTKIKRATMVLNGRPKEITVKDGRFSQEVALTQENNAVLIEAEDDEGGFSTSRSVSFVTMNVKPKDIMIILTWDKPNADLDLHVYGPGGGHTCYKNPNIYESNEAIPGAQIEQDAKGNYGPEVFTMDNMEAGIYAIKSNYFYSGGDGDAHATVTVILYGDNPARRIVRVFGPHLQVDTKTGEEMWDVARFKMPEGIFLED